MENIRYWNGATDREMRLGTPQYSHSSHGPPVKGHICCSHQPVVATSPLRPPGFCDPPAQGLCPPCHLPGVLVSLVSLVTLVLPVSLVLLVLLVHMLGHGLVLEAGGVTGVTGTSRRAPM